MISRVPPESHLISRTLFANSRNDLLQRMGRN